MGIRVEADNARILQNSIVNEVIVRNPYRSTHRAIGIALGIDSSFSYVKGNYTHGFDNGVGPAQQFTSPSFWVYDHVSYLDTTPISSVGVLNDEE